MKMPTESGTEADFRWRAYQCRTNADAFDLHAAAIWDLAADALRDRTPTGGDGKGMQAWQDPSDVAVIAASLVEVAPPAPRAIDDRPKRLVLALTDEWARLSTAMLPHRASPFVMTARRLKERGLVESRQEPGGVVFWRLTSLGLAVREHLRGGGE